MLRSILKGFAGSALMMAVAAPVLSQQPATCPVDGDVTVPGTVAVASLMSLAEGHLQTLAGHLTLVARTDAARSGKWSRVRPALADVAGATVPAVLWYALPDGSYSTLVGDHAGGNLLKRAYFARLMAGQPVLGDLVVSQATGRNVAIVAVPVRDAAGRVVAAVGSSVYLDSLSQRLTREMALPDGYLFYAVDGEPRGALHHDLTLIFTEPLTLGADLARAIREMLAHEAGVVSYRFLNTTRTVTYRKSAVTGWWYALGTVRP